MGRVELFHLILWSRC